VTDDTKTAATESPPDAEATTEKPLRFSQEQWKMLVGCDVARDTTTWNEACENRASDAPLLEGADFFQIHLAGVDLVGAHLEGAEMRESHFQKARLTGAHLERAKLGHAHLEGAGLRMAHLQGADLQDAHLEGACLHNAHLEGADFTDAIVDGETLIVGCTYDKETNFTGVALRSARVRPQLRSALEANVRRLMWTEWYQASRLNRWILQPFVRFFWFLSGYGTSTKRLLGLFMTFALAFALVYWLCPGMVEGTGWNTQVSSGTALVRSIYFSVVTMTTLGFGDMHAASGNIPGYVLLTLHVFLGYILLGSLITRFAIMFQEA
jgi:hypothetical protein